MSTIRILSTDEIRSLVSMNEAISLMRDAFSELSSGGAIVPQRLAMEMHPENSRALLMPAYSARMRRYVTKIVTLAGNNPVKGFPFIQGLLILFDSDRGVPLALMDAGYVTALRTGAASGLATDLLARRNSQVAVIFGAGVQARTQLEGIASVRKLEEVYVYSPVNADSERYADEMGKKLNLSVVVAQSPAIAAKADIICTATTSGVPVFSDADVKPGTHINGIGSYKPTLREIPSETIKRSSVVVDSRASALAEAGDLIIPISEGVIAEKHICAELGE
ncbi:MAG TPA: hypothetical protein VI758_00380, partial [Bacteroidota bacterium]